ncbi:MAG: hypothetical protein Q8Q76_00750 [Methylotenera sp.]|nr:hypothetical protein [Methylotenera sp.]
MKYLLIICAIFFSTHANAEIFICKDKKNKVNAQNFPCEYQTLKKMKEAPAIPIEEQMRANQRFEELKARELKELAYQKAIREEEDKAYEARKQRELAERQHKEQMEFLARQEEQEIIRRNQAMRMERKRMELLERQTQAIEDAARNNQQNAPINRPNAPVHCIPDYSGGFICN